MKPVIAKTIFTKKLNLFFKLFFVILLAAIMLYNAFVFLHKESIKSMNAESLSKTAANYAQAVQYARSVANQIYHDPDKENYLESIDVVEKFRYKNRLNSYLVTTRFLESVDIISNKEMHHVGAERNDAALMKFVNDHKSYIEPVVRVVESEDDKVREFKVYSMVYYETLEADGTVSNAVVLNFEERWAEQFINANGDGQHFFITDEKNQLLLSSMNIDSYLDFEYQLNECLGEKEGFAKIKNIDKSDTTYYASRTHADGKVYTVLTGEERFVKTFRTTLLMTIIVCLSFCVLIWLAVFIYSKYFLMVIRQIKQQLELSEDKYTSSKEKLKSNYLMEMLSGDETAIAGIAEKVEEFDMAIDTKSSQRLFLIEIDNKRKYIGNTQHLSALKKLIKESFGAWFCGEWVQPDDTQLLFVTGFAEDGYIRDKITEIQCEFSDKTEASASVFVSCELKNICELAESYKQLLRLKKKKFVSGSGCLLFCTGAEEDSEKIDTSVYYNFEQNILDALKRKQEAKAIAFFEEFLTSDFVRSNVYNAAELVKKMLFSSFLQMQSDETENSLLLFKRIDGIETVHDAEILFADMVKQNIIEKRNKTVAGQKLVSAVENYIEDHYTDSNLSVSVIAAHVELSPGYLGQLYKKHRNMGISDCINAKRMEHAKILLETTNRSIIDIAESVGITNKTQFYKLFKKYYNATPTSFR